MSAIRKKRQKLDAESSSSVFGLEHNGIAMTTQEFDSGDFDELYDYELINGSLIVLPPANEEELTISEELNYHLRTYCDRHPEGSRMITTLPSQYLLPSEHRLRIDRAVWTGPGEASKKKRFRPTIAIDIPSQRIRRRPQDYRMRCDQCMQSGVEEYWIVDRFTKTLKVKTCRTVRWRVISEHQNYETPLLPGFMSPLKRMFDRAAEWAEGDETQEKR